MTGPSAVDKATVLCALAASVASGAMTVSEALQRAFELGAISGKINGLADGIEAINKITERAQT